MCSRRKVGLDTQRVGKCLAGPFHVVAVEGLKSGAAPDERSIQLEQPVEYGSHPW